MGGFSIFQWIIIGTIGWMLFSVFGSRRNGTSQAYVIKDWFASETPNHDGIYVNIEGRKGGLMSFLMALVGIDPTVSLVIDRENVRFRSGSWTGYSSWVTPLNRLCSGKYGYSKPLWVTVVWIVIGVALLLPSFGISLILIVGAFAYYFLNKIIVLELTYIGGGSVHSSDALAFKRSVIEGKHIDEHATERIVAIIEMIVLGSDKPRAPSVDAGGHATLGETLNRAASELTTVAERTRQRTEALAAQARQMGERAAAKVSSSLAASSAAAPLTADPGARQCPKCGASAAPGSVFCGECGFKMT